MKNRSKIKRLIFDADDTLWENNIHYIKAAEDLVNLIVPLGYLRENIEQEFQTLERDVVREKGYGSENYVYVLRTLFEKYTSDQQRNSLKEKIDEICFVFESHLHTPPKIFPEVPSILEELRKVYPLFVLTKGNIDEQRRKLENSNLLLYFRKTFVVTEKDTSTYRRLLEDNNWDAEEVCMIGNSPKSDINPALQLGMCAVLIPYQHTWVLEEEPLAPDQTRLKIVSSFSDLPKLFLGDN